jgi:hypothetical protein
VRISRHVTEHASRNAQLTCETNMTIQRDILIHPVRLLMDVGAAGFPWLQVQNAGRLPLELNLLRRSRFRQSAHHHLHGQRHRRSDALQCRVSKLQFEPSRSTALEN